MKNRTDYISLKYLEEIFKSKKNIYQTLKKKYKNKIPKEKLIEISYDIQTGYYISVVKSNKKIFENIWKEYSKVINRYLKPRSIILDAGVGEFTNHCGIINSLDSPPKKVFAFDLSLSRIIHGIDYLKKNYPQQYKKISPFCSDMVLLPLPDSSIDLIYSVHALEPNKSNIKKILKELFRVAKKTLIFFEPSSIYNSEEGKKRMQKLDFITDLDPLIEDLGGKLVEKWKTENTTNKLNPTACYVVQLEKKNVEKPNFTTPGTNFKLRKRDNFYQCKEFGLHYPILKNIPLFREQFGVLASVLVKDKQK